MNSDKTQAIAFTNKRSKPTNQAFIARHNILWRTTSHLSPSDQKNKSSFPRTQTILAILQKQQLKINIKINLHMMCVRLIITYNHQI